MRDPLYDQVDKNSVISTDYQIACFAIECKFIITSLAKKKKATCFTNISKEGY